MARNVVDYDADFFAWTQEQAERLRAGELSQIDTVNLAEEIESMGKGTRREVRSRLILLVAHLLKWQCQPGFRSRSWSSPVREERRQINDLLDESPSLRPVLAEELDRLYSSAREGAADDTGLIETAFPADCPFTVDQILAQDFLPD